jgi:hypothetical protein
MRVRTSISKTRALCRSHLRGWAVRATMSCGSARCREEADAAAVRVQVLMHMLREEQAKVRARGRGPDARCGAAVRACRGVS